MELQRKIWDFDVAFHHHRDFTRVSQQNHTPSTITNATGSTQVTYTSNGAPEDPHSTNNPPNHSRNVITTEFYITFATAPANISRAGTCERTSRDLTRVSQQTHTPSTITNATGSAQVTYTSNGAPEDSRSTNNPPNHSSTHQTSFQPNSISHSQQHPQTPAEQVLVSAPDRWGLLGLLAMLKNAGTDLDQGLNGIGTDLGTMGLDMVFPGCVGAFYRGISELTAELTGKIKPTEHAQGQSIALELLPENPPSVLSPLPFSLSENHFLRVKIEADLGLRQGSVVFQWS